MNGIQNIINSLDKSSTPIDKWERIKLKVKEFSVNFSIFQQKIIKTRTKIIEQEIEKMESGRTEDFDYRKLKELEAELDDIHDKRTKGAQIRSKAKWIEDGEKNTSYF